MIKGDKVKTIGVALETKEDAKKSGVIDLNFAYHWREAEEIKKIVNAIEAAGFSVVLIGSPEKLILEVEKFRNKIDFIFNLSVGFVTRYRLSRGPNLYSLLGIPYSGADPYTKMVSQNKHLMKSLWDKIGIPTPKWVYIHSVDEIENMRYPKFPLIVKPAYEGSSIGLDKDSVVSNYKDLFNRAKDLFAKLKMPVIVEHFIEGKEFKVGIIGNEEKEFVGVIEDISAETKRLGNEFLHFNAKHTGQYKKRRISSEKIEDSSLIEDSLKIYKLFIPIDYGVIDARVDEKGQHYFIEFNADATLHPKRTLASCCSLHGVSYNEMIQKILKTSFQRWNIK